MGSIFDTVINFLWNVIQYLWASFLATLTQIFILVGPGIILAFIMQKVASFVEKNALKLFGRSWYLGLFGWLGTSIHEIGHAMFCILFRHKINEIKFFDPDPYSGSLGYVRHSYEPGNTYQEIGNFFIGIGPVILGSVIIYFLSIYLFGNNIFESMTSIRITSDTFQSFDSILIIGEQIINGIGDIFRAIFKSENLTNWKFYLFIYLVFSIGSSITLSPADIKGATEGLIFSFIMLFVFNITTVWAGDFVLRVFGDISQINAILYLVMIFAIVINVMIALLIFFMPASFSIARKTIQTARRNKV